MIYTFTSAAVNYLPKVRLLCRSIKRHHPEFHIVLGLADVMPEWLTVDEEPFDEVITINDLKMKDQKSWMFRHTIVELSTAIKPFILDKLLARDECEAVLYFDPDMVLFSRLDDLLNDLGQANIGLTPHQTIPESDLEAIIGNEIESLKCGIYNLGFIAVRKCMESQRFAAWWSHRLYHFCRAAVQEGLFTDQRWIDFVPVYFEGVKILKTSRFNVATWNLTTRKLTGSLKTGFVVDGTPLGFYHFTGFDSGDHKIAAQKYAPGNASVQELIEWYQRETKAQTDDQAKATSWRYGQFSNGARILPQYRRIYRERPDLQKTFPDPFEVTPEGNCYLTWLKISGIQEYPELLGPVAKELAKKELTLSPVGAGKKSDETLTVILETELPTLLKVGKGNSFYLSGYCFHSHLQIDGLEILVGEETCSTLIHSVDRPDVAERYSKDRKQFRLAQRSGFWGIIKVPEIKVETEKGVFLRVTLRDKSKLTYQIGRIKLLPRVFYNTENYASALSQSAGGQPLISICMATHNPSLELFKRQIESIRCQTYENWVCLISDDASDALIVKQMREVIGSDSRFMVFPFPERLGFYNNFERALSLIPSESVFVALSDQDDYWYPTKLEKLVEQFDSQTMLVYSDMRIVKDSGEKISDTYWITRKNNSEDFCSLTLANTVTGAASLFRKELLEDCLPFPFKVGNLFHDHWIGMIALATGKVKYIDEPLYDYVQHNSNIVGHVSPVREPLSRIILETFRIMRSAQGRLLARGIYQSDVMKIQAISNTAMMRTGDRMDVMKKRTLARLARLDQSLLTLVWLMARGLKDRGEKSVTIAAEYHLSLGLMWKHYIYWKSKFKQFPLIGAFLGPDSAPMRGLNRQDG